MNRVYKIWPYVGLKKPTIGTSIDETVRQVLNPIVVNDNISADKALQILRKRNKDQYILFRGDYHVCKQLVDSMSRRITNNYIKNKNKGFNGVKNNRSVENSSYTFEFNSYLNYRRYRVEQATILEKVLIPCEILKCIESGNEVYRIPLKRSPPKINEVCQYIANVQSAVSNRNANDEFCGTVADMVPPQMPSVSPSSASSQDVLIYECVVPFRKLSGYISSYQLHERGVKIPLLGCNAPPQHLTVFPWYGVFPPTRFEYLEALQTISLPEIMTQAYERMEPEMEHMDAKMAYDIGTGSGIISLLLVKVHGLSQVLATDIQWASILCASKNIQYHKLEKQIQTLHCNMFPPKCETSGTFKRVGLIVCNPPWLPSVDAYVNGQDGDENTCAAEDPHSSHSALDMAVFDTPDSAMLKDFLFNLKEHLIPPSTDIHGKSIPGGEGWLILSNLAVLLKLRHEHSLLEWIESSGLVLLDQIDVSPNHNKSQDGKDGLYDIRRKEVTSLYRLAIKSQ